MLIPNSIRQAKTIAPRRHCVRGAKGGANEATVAAVVKTVSVAVWLAAPEIVTGDVPPKLNVGGSTAPAGELVTAAVKLTLPVKPPVGVTVMVDALFVVAPGTTVRLVPVRPIIGFGTGLTITGSEPLPAL